MDLAVTDTTLLTFQGDGPGVIENGAVGVEMDKISFVGKARDLDENRYETVIDGSGHVTMPGLIDAHIHSGLALLRGTAQDVPEREWMDKALGPITKNMGKSDLIAGSKLGVMEGLKSGTTTFGEFTKGVDDIIENVHQPFGARVVGAETINEVIDREEETYRLESSTPQLKENERLFKKYGHNDLVNIMYGPQALDMVTLETLTKIQEKAEEHDRGIHMHVAQGGRERKQIENRYGCSTVEKLKDEDLLTSKLLAAHCHGTNEEEKRTLVKNGVSMVGCPSSIGMIDGIVPPINSFVSLGGKASLGSDQVPGNGAHNIFREMRTISLLSKCVESDPTALPAWETLKLGTKNGAEALGLEDKVGALEESKKADIITIDLEKVNLSPSLYRPFRNLIPNLIYSSTGVEVDNVIINGKKVLRDGEFVDIDKNEVKKEAERRGRNILMKSKSDWRSAESKMVEYQRKDLL